MPSILLLVCAVADILLALIFIVVQAIITVNHGDCAYSKMAVGIWTGLLLLVTAGVLLFISFRKGDRAHIGALILCAMAFMACFVLAGVAAGVIYQIYSLQFFDRAGSGSGYIPYLGNLNQWVGQIFLQLGEKFINQAIYYAQIRLCYCFPITDYFGRTRKSLEAVLLAFGLIAIIIQLLSMVVLYIKGTSDDDRPSPRSSSNGTSSNNNGGQQNRGFDRSHDNPPVRQLPSSRL